MEFLSSTEEASEPETVLTPRKPKMENCLAVCVLSFYLKKTLSSLGSSRFIRVLHASPYNTYVREREKIKDSKMDLFLRLRSIGIESRIGYIVRLKPLSVETYVEIVSGEIVVSEALTGAKSKQETEAIYVTVDVFGNIVNHTLYADRSVSLALESVIPRNTDENSPFYEYDTKHLNQLPTTRKEAMMHPLYGIDPEHKRYIVYPRSVGWVGHIKDTKTKKHALKSKEQKEKGLRIYPRSHIFRLLTRSEVVRQNRKLEKSIRPFRILQSTNRHHPEGIGLYAPWQVQTSSVNPGIVATPKQIPPNSVYLVETEIVKFEIEGSITPVIGRRYDYLTQTEESVRGGVLVERKYFTENRSKIMRDIHRSIIRSLVVYNKSLILNMQILSIQAMRYIEIVESLNKNTYQRSTN